MKMLIKISAIFAILVLQAVLTGCSEEQIPEENWLISEPDHTVLFVVVDEDDNNLLDPAVENNILDEEIFVMIQDRKLPLMPKEKMMMHRGQLYIFNDSDEEYACSFDFEALFSGNIPIVENHKTLLLLHGICCWGESITGSLNIGDKSFPMVFCDNKDADKITTDAFISPCGYAGFKIVL